MTVGEMISGNIVIVGVPPPIRQRQMSLLSLLNKLATIHSSCVVPVVRAWSIANDYIERWQERFMWRREMKRRGRKRKPTSFLAPTQNNPRHDMIPICRVGKLLSVVVVMMSCCGVSFSTDKAAAMFNEVPTAIIETIGGAVSLALFIAASVSSSSSSVPPSLSPTITKAAPATGEMMSNNEDEIITSSFNNDDDNEARKKIDLLCKLVCHAVSSKCIHQHTHVAAIMNMTDRTYVQEEIVRIVQEQQQQQQQNGGEGEGRMQHNEEEDEEYENTDDYSILSILEATTMTDDYSILLHEGGSAAGAAAAAAAKNDDRQGEGLLLLHHNANETNITVTSSTATPSGTSM
jgi:hypothetical protein